MNVETWNGHSPFSVHPVHHQGCCNQYNTWWNIYGEELLFCVYLYHYLIWFCTIIVNCVSSFTCSDLGSLMNVWTFRLPARWAHGLVWWHRTANNNIMYGLVKYCLGIFTLTVPNRVYYYIWICFRPAWCWSKWFTNIEFLLQWLNKETSHWVSSL